MWTTMHRQHIRTMMTHPSRIFRRRTRRRLQIIESQRLRKRRGERFCWFVSILNALFVRNGTNKSEPNPFEEEEWDEGDGESILVDNGEPGVPVKALYDYDGAESDELTFKQGESRRSIQSNWGQQISNEFSLRRRNFREARRRGRARMVQRTKEWQSRPVSGQLCWSHSNVNSSHR